MKLLYMSPREFHTTDASPTVESDPVWYTVEGNTFLVQPVSTAGTGKLGYYQSFPPLGSVAGDADTNALLTKYPSLFLYSALVAAFSWARNSKQATENFSLYTSVAEGLHQTTVRSQRSGQSLYPQILNAT